MSKYNFTECKVDLNSAKISQDDLEKREKRIVNYWCKESKVISDKLWLPKNNYGDTKKKSIKGIFRPDNSYHIDISDQKSKARNAKKVTSLDIKLPKYKEEELNYSRKIKILPTKLQKEVFNKCMIGSNYHYNLAIDYLNTIENEIINKLKIRFNEEKNYVSFKQAKFIVEKSKVIPKFYDVRKLLLVREKNMTKDNIWLKDIPRHTKAEAIHDALTSFELNIKNYLKKVHNSLIYASKNNVLPKEVKKFIMNKREEYKMFHIEKNQIWFKEKILMVSRTEKNQFKVSNKEYNKFKNETNGASKILFIKPNKWFLCLSLKRKSTDLPKTYNNVSLDPGVRTFQTFYSTDGVIGKIGDNVNKRLYHLGKRIDKLISVESYYKSFHRKEYNKKAYRIRRRISILRNKIKNIVDDLHHKSANYLTKNYKTIIIPNTNITNMVSNDTSNLTKETKRSLLALSHYKFREYLKFLAHCRNSQVIEVSESHTSKTCGACGVIHTALGGNKVFECVEKCGYHQDRDIHGARNIMIRTLTYSGLMWSSKTSKNEKISKTLVQTSLLQLEPLKNKES